MQNMKKHGTLANRAMAALLCLCLVGGFLSPPARAAEATPTLNTTKLTLNGADTYLTFRSTDKDALNNYLSKVTSVSVNGEALESGQYTIEASTGSTSPYSGYINILRTDKKPIFSQTERSKDYAIVVKAAGYDDVTSTMPVINYGSKAFTVRYVNDAGQVAAEKVFPMEELKSHANAKAEQYYTVGCGMAGMRMFVGDGVLLEDLLKGAGIPVGPGQQIQIRTNDKTTSENDPQTGGSYAVGEGYYRPNGLFTYEHLLGRPRYFVDVYKTGSEAAITALLASMNKQGGNWSEETRTLAYGFSRTEVKPLIAWDYKEDIFKSDQTKPTKSDYSQNVQNERAFRFLFGTALADTGDMMHGETTTWSATYTAFGVDVIGTADLAKASISGVLPSYAATDKAITPKPTVKCGDTTLVEGTDYTLSYENNVATGTATVKITAAAGSVFYKGEKSVSFQVVDAPLQLVGYRLWDSSLNRATGVEFTETMDPTVLTGDGQSQNILLKFNKPIAITSKEDVLSALDILISGDVTASTVRGVESVAVDAQDPTLLRIVVRAKVGQTPAQAGSSVTIKAKNASGFVSAITGRDNGGEQAFFPYAITTIQPTGLRIAQVASTTGTSTVPASVTYKITSLPLVRSMNFLQFTSNGAPVGNYIVHSHMFMNLRDSDYLGLLSTAATTGLNTAGYTFELVGDTFKVTAKTASAGEVLGWRVNAYPYRNINDNKIVIAEGLSKLTNSADRTKAEAVLYDVNATAAEVAEILALLDRIDQGNGDGSTGGGGGSGTPAPAPVRNEQVEKKADDAGTATLKPEELKRAESLTVTGGTASGNASLQFDTKALEAIAAAGTGDVKVQVSKLDASALSGEQKGNLSALVKSSAEQSGPVYSFKVTVGTTAVTDFKGGEVLVSLDYTPASGEAVNQLLVFHLRDNGSVTIIRDCYYDAANGKLIFSANGFSYFQVGNSKDLKQPMFQDVSAGAWYYESVSYLLDRGLIAGKTATSFAPEADITRAEFVQMLYNRSKGAQGAAGAGIDFRDVSAGAWYYDAVTWASKSGVVVGSGGQFRPGDTISRQEMAVILDRYTSQVEKVTLEKTVQPILFTDVTDIATWAGASVATMQQAGIINGMGSNGAFQFVPNANATRAQAAKMIADLVQLL